MSEEEKVNVPIPKSLYKKIEEEIKDSDFESVEEYVTFVLREVLSEEEEEEEVFSKEEEEQVKERLRSLGYLD